MLSLLYSYRAELLIALIILLTVSAFLFLFYFHYFFSVPRFGPTIEDLKPLRQHCHLKDSERLLIITAKQKEKQSKSKSNDNDHVNGDDNGESEESESDLESESEVESVSSSSVSGSSTGRSESNRSRSSSPSTAPSHNAALIFLHGLGDSGHGLAPIAARLLSRFPSLKVILPHAPQGPLTFSRGRHFSRWHDIPSIAISKSSSSSSSSSTPAFSFSLSSLQPDQFHGLQDSIRTIHSLIESEIHSGIPSENIFIAGFSMGGAVALASAFEYPTTLGAAFAFSSYLPYSPHSHHDFQSKLHSNNAKLPAFLFHGSDDAIVPCLSSRRMCEILELSGVPVVLHEVNGLGHGMNEQIVQTMESILESKMINHVTKQWKKNTEQQKKKMMKVNSATKKLEKENGSEIGNGSIRSRSARSR